eukprot:303852-Rhodomonas_salina.11
MVTRSSGVDDDGRWGAGFALNSLGHPAGQLLPFPHASDAESLGLTGRLVGIVQHIMATSGGDQVWMPLCFLDADAVALCGADVGGCVCEQQDSPIQRGSFRQQGSVRGEVCNLSAIKPPPCNAACNASPSALAHAPC